MQAAKRPLSRLSAGQECAFAAFHLSRQPASAAQELSLRPSLLAAARAGQRADPPLLWSAVVPGERYVAVVTGVHQKKRGTYLGASLSQHVKGRVGVLMSSPEAGQLSTLGERKPGSLVVVTVASVHVKQQRLELSLLRHPEFALMGPHSGGPQVCASLLRRSRRRWLLRRALRSAARALCLADAPECPIFKCEPADSALKLA